MAYQLYRTNVALTGNVKMGCYLEKGEVYRCSLNPLSSAMPIYPYGVNLKYSTYGRDLVQFYKKYAAGFYSPHLDPKVTEKGDFKEIIPDDKFFNPTPGDGQYGLKRVSLKKNGKELTVFAPVFINNENEIPRWVRFITSTSDGNPIYEKTIDLTESSLYDYLLRSLEGMNGYDGYNPHIINVDPEAEYSAVRGISTTSGGMIEVKSDLLSRCLEHGMAYSEFNRYICAEFERYGMVCPWILNLCWYFDIDDIIPSRELCSIADFNTVMVDVEYLDSNYNKLAFGDLDFNTYYLEGNILDYLHDPQVTEIKHEIIEHMQPCINSWVVGASDYIFNAYPGFDAMNSSLKEDPDNITPSLNYNIDMYADRSSYHAHNLGWIKFLGYKCKTLKTKFNIDTVKQCVGSDIKTMYFDNSYQLHRYPINNGKCMCNGVMLNTGVLTYWMLEDLGGGYVLSDNCELSVSIVNSINTIDEAPKHVLLLRMDDYNSGNTIVSIDWIIINPQGVADTDIEEIKKKVYSNPLLNGLIIKQFNSVTPADGDRGIRISAIYKIGETKYYDWVCLASSEEGFLIPAGGEDKFGNSGFSIDFNQAFYINDALVSEQQIGGEYKLYSSGQDLRLTRYFGWIQPRVVTDTDQIYTCIRHVDAAPATTQWCPGYDIIKLSDIGGYYPGVFLGRELPEWKGYTTSQFIVVPKEVVVNRKVTDPDLTLKEIFAEYTGESKYIDYIYRLYDSSIDMNNDKTEYIIKYTLK